METETISVMAQGRGEQEKGTNATVMRYPSGQWKNSKLDCGYGYTIFQIQEKSLYTLNGWTVWYVHCILAKLSYINFSIGKNKQHLKEL